MTTWKSVIYEAPDQEELRDSDPTSTAYPDWVYEVMEEPWVRGLEDLVKWTGVWFGSEERLFEELKMRAGKEVSASPDFPSSLEQLNEYIDIAIDGFCMKNLKFLDYRETSEEDREDFDVPGWGPEAPLLVWVGDAAERPDYWKAMYDLLCYRHPLPVNILVFTDRARDFRKWRRWRGTTTELVEKLSKYTPLTIRNVPIFMANLFRPEEKHRDYVLYPDVFPYDPLDVINLLTREDYLLFHKRMRKWAPILKGGCEDQDKLGEAPLFPRIARKR
jgi:hypothetical protein